METNRRKFFRHSLASVTGLAAATMLPEQLFGSGRYNTSGIEEIIVPQEKRVNPKGKIRFSVIGINHSHIYGMVDALNEGGGSLVAVYSKKPSLVRPHCGILTRQ